MKVQGIYKKDDLGYWQPHQSIAIEDLLGRGKYKDISCITSLGKNIMEADKLKGFCHARFKANLIIEKLDLQLLREKSKLQIGKATVEVITIGKKCHDTCPAFGDKHSCSFKRHIFFCNVIKEGTIQYNDIVEII